MKEIPVLFGPESSLLGVVCQPAAASGSGVACLMLNAGVVPRIGPHRINVKLARILAEAGIASIRFDLSGLGDSSPTRVARDFLQQAILDVRAAMDYLERVHGMHRFIIIGNCSGAVHAYWTALADQRVIGIQMFDGFCYRSKWSRLARHWQRFHAASWRKSAVALARRLAQRVHHPLKDANIFAAQKSHAKPPRAAYCQGMQTLADRGVAVFLIFSGSIIDDYSYARQFHDAFAGHTFVDQVRCDFLPEVDHTLLALDAQRRFLGLIRDWAAGIAAAGYGKTDNST